MDAQREYAAKDWNGDGVTEFARKFRSTPGKKDGLYWETKEGEEESPFGALVATAAQEGYAKAQKNAKPAPFHGYYFKILTAQGKHAEGGAFDYVVNGKMILGYRSGRLSGPVWRVGRHDLHREPERHRLSEEPGK